MSSSSYKRCLISCKALNHQRLASSLGRQQCSNILGCCQSSSVAYTNYVSVRSHLVSIASYFLNLSRSISTARAKDIFLSQYYDPYYPELHLYVTRPDPFRLSMAHTSHWSIFSIPDTFHREGIKGVVLDAWNGVAMSAWDWQQSLWEAWGTAEPVSWPPT